MRYIMERITDDMTINVSRGDNIRFSISCRIAGTDTLYTFPAGSVLRFTIARNLREKYLIQKTVELDEDTDIVYFELSGDETRELCDETAKPREFYYDIILNGTKSLVCFDDKTGAKKFILYPRTYEEEQEGE